MTLRTTKGPTSEWTVARDLAVRLEDAEPDWDFAGPYLAWEEGSIARGGLGVFAALPAGEYAIARVPAGRLREPALAGGTRIAVEAEHFGQPLVGLVGLGPDGEELLVLQPLVRVPAPSFSQDGDAIVVVPVSGELVVDAGWRGQPRLNAWRHRARSVLQ